MNKSWRFTAVVAALSAVLAGVYFLSSPPGATPLADLDDHVLKGLTAEQVTKIEVTRKDGTGITFERAKDSVGEYWRIAGANSQAADNAMVQQMLFGLDRFLKAGALDPSKPEARPDLTGVQEPRLTVALSSAGRRDVLRFGKTPPSNTTVSFYQHEGDPKIYLVGIDTVEAFNKPAFQYRAKALVRYTPHRVTRVAIDYRFVRGVKGKPPVVEYEKSVMERFEEGTDRGWWLTQPHREKLDDHKAQALVSELSMLPAGDYQAPSADPKDQGFDEPEARVSLFLNGEEKPVQIEFGGLAERGKKRFVRVPGAAEVALYDTFRFDELPLQRSHFRTTAIFPFSSEVVKRLEVEAKDLGKVVLERREIKKDGEAVGAVKWEVVHPTDLRVESERLDAFVSAVIAQQITGFMGAQDFKLADLDPAPIQVRVETRDGKRHVCGFSVAVDGYLRKEGINEIFIVRPDFVRMLQRLELNFVNMEMFNIPRDRIREFTFESRRSEELQPVYYTIRLDATGKKWVFADPAHKDVEPDPDRVGNLTTLMNYIKAEALLARDTKTIEKFRLDPTVCSSTLKIVHQVGDPKDNKTEVSEVYISDNQSDKPTQPLYYARMKDNLAVFQINGLFVATLKQVPVLKKEEK